MGQYNFDLAPNGGNTIEVSGTFFTYKGGLGPIRVTTSKGEVVDLLPGQGMSQVQFDRLTIKDTSGAANTGIILAGSGAWRDERITGSVEIIDGGRTRTLANQAFMVRGYSPAVAGNTPELQLWNPASSGKRVVVSRVTRSSSAAGTVHLPITATMRATDAGKGVSKLSGGAASVAQLRVGTKVGVQDDPNVLSSDSVTPGTPLVLQFIEPVVLLPGYGLHMASTGLGNDVSGSFEFFEETI